MNAEDRKCLGVSDELGLTLYSESSLFGNAGFFSYEQTFLFPNKCIMAILKIFHAETV